jgi:hypothetical protein
VGGVSVSVTPVQHLAWVLLSKIVCCGRKGEDWDLYRTFSCFHTEGVLFCAFVCAWGGGGVKMMKAWREPNVSSIVGKLPG